MIELSARLQKVRKQNGLTQAAVADAIGVTAQAVSQWENGDTLPDILKLAALAKLYKISVDWLLGEEPKALIAEVASNVSERFFDEKRMYTQVKAFAAANNYYDTMRALPFAREKHAGQFRKGEEHVPYIYHPLLLACHAISLGIASDELLAVCLLHDVVEDCGITEKELPVSAAVQYSVKLLSKPADYKKERDADAYYSAIAEDSTASVVKILDRCSNLSGMSISFSPMRMAQYIQETETYILPLLKSTSENYPGYYHALYTVKYHMISVITAVKCRLRE